MFSWFQSQFLCWYKIKPFLIIISPFNSPFHLTVPTNPSHMLVKSPPFPTSCVPFPRFSHFPSSSPQICPDPKLPVAILFYLTCQLIAFSFLQSTQLIKCLLWQPPLLSNCFTSWFLHLPLISPLSHSHSFPLTHTSWLSLSAQMIPTSLPHVSCPVIGPQHCSSRPFQPIQTALSQAGRRRCLQIPMRDSFSHLHVTSCDAFRRGLWRPLTRSAATGGCSSPPPPPPQPLADFKAGVGDQRSRQ